MFVIFLVTACSNINTNSETNNDILKQKEATDVEINLTEEDREVFDQFFDKFRTDTLFQLDRIRFPILRRSLDLYDDSYLEEYIKKGAWKHLDFNEEDISTREFDKYTQEINEIGEDTVNIELRGIDNGISIDFVFKIEEYHWYLILIEDEST